MVDYRVKRFNKYSDAELIERLHTFSDKAGVAFVSARAFSDAAGISEATIVNHFGSWSTFCERAGLSPRYRRAVTREDLFKNLDCVWQQLGRQPRAREMKQPLSPISISRYRKELQMPWYQVCLEFLSWKSGATVQEIEGEALATSASGSQPSHATRRQVSLSLRYEVLKRDGFRCVRCGRSPAIEPGVQLHVDHIVPWAKSGETVLANLQCLCSDCNLGKSDAHTC